MAPPGGRPGGTAFIRDEGIRAHKSACDYPVRPWLAIVIDVAGGLFLRKSGRRDRDDDQRPSSSAAQASGVLFERPEGRFGGEVVEPPRRVKPKETPADFKGEEDQGGPAKLSRAIPAYRPDFTMFAEPISDDRRRILTDGAECRHAAAPRRPSGNSAERKPTHADRGCGFAARRYVLSPGGIGEVSATDPQATRPDLRDRSLLESRHRAGDEKVVGG